MTLKLKVRENERALRTPDIWHIYASECAYVFLHWILMYRNATCSANGFQCIPKSTHTQTHSIPSNVSIARCHAQKRCRRATERVCNVHVYDVRRLCIKYKKIRFSWKTIISIRSQKWKKMSESIVFCGDLIIFISIRMYGTCAWACVSMRLRWPQFDSQSTRQFIRL